MVSVIELAFYNVEVFGYPCFVVSEVAVFRWWWFSQAR